MLFGSLSDRDDGDYFLSISFPPDYGDAETALFRGDELVYNEDWGYEDIRRGFGTGDPADSSTIDALVAEIRRLGTNNPGHPDLSDSEPEPEPEPAPAQVAAPIYFARGSFRLLLIRRRLVTVLR